MTEGSHLPKLPTWKSHKIVEAAKIVRTMKVPPMSGEQPDSEYLELILETPEGVLHLVKVRPDFGNNRKDGPNASEPLVGGYYVRYADGYESWSPAKAFEEGYTQVLEHLGVTYRSYASEDVLRERVNQRMKWAQGHDDLFTRFELVAMAQAYLTGDAVAYWPTSLTDIGVPLNQQPYRKRLVKAAALLLAEIERVDRLTKRKLRKEGV